MVNFSKIAGMGQKKPKPKTVSSGRKVSKKKQQMGMGKGKKGLGMTNVMTGQQTTRTSKPKVKRAIDTQNKRLKSPVAVKVKPKPTLRQRIKRLTGLAGGGKASKYRMKGGGKTSKYMAKGGKTSKYMARGGRAK